MLPGLPRPDYADMPRAQVHRALSAHPETWPQPHLHGSRAAVPESHLRICPLADVAATATRQIQESILATGISALAQ